ncbi:TPA: hypothetical protein DEF17_09175 [bacterium]|nr:MAG: hypothetical protein COS94_02700 [Candidatus Hydrogenedentes bacterium CG07_land_8_20_14_0_80_42_17]HBW48079.1 hypothetical protein [bacterium]
MKRFGLILLISSAFIGLSCSKPDLGIDNKNTEKSDTTPVQTQISSVPAVMVINESNPGSTIDISNYRVEGKKVIFDFYSEYCPPCRKIAPVLEHLASIRKDIVIRKIDINRKGVSGIDWASPVAAQYSIESIPYFILMSETGEIIAKGDEASNQIFKWFNENNL